MITDKQAKALRIIRDADRPITGRGFAEEMWKDSEGWKRYHNIGYGATRGSGMWLSAGSWLEKLRRAELIWLDFTGTNTKIWRITTKGRKELEEYENEQSR